VEYEDRVTIQTPEGVDLQLTLAGVGSRFVAAITDFLIQNALVIAAALALLGGSALTGDDVATGLGAALFFIVLFLVIFGYDILFEVFASGRTPGKRATGIRVVRSGGEPVGFLTSAVRNVLRLVDFLPFMYAVGIVAILVTRRNQRLGDIAAGTLVVRERLGARRRRTAPRPIERPVSEASGWDVGGVTGEEVAAVRSFLERRWELEADPRADVARALAEKLRPKVSGAAAGLGDEEFLEALAATKARRG
jgi:uncharacterized RDD family membrane protein YckC